MKKPGSTAYACRPAKHPIQVGPVLVRIHYREAELRKTVKAAGGQWQPQESSLTRR